MANFINAEIARQCPNPSASSQLIIDDLPLVLMGCVSLAHRESFFGNPQIRSTIKLVDDVSGLMIKCGMPIAKGSLMRKVCGKLLSQYTALCVSRRYAEANAQLVIIGSGAKIVFCTKFKHLLGQSTKSAEQGFGSSLTPDDLNYSLYDPWAVRFIDGRITCAASTRKIIKLGRVLFK